MSGGGDKDYSGFSLLELFRSEAESQVQVLTAGLLALDRNAQDLTAIAPLMRAAHSLKGAARIVNLDDVERLAHAMEDCFVAAQKGRLRLNKQRIDRLLAGVDLINRISSLSEEEAPAWLEKNRLMIGELLVGVYDTSDPAKLNEEPPQEPETITLSDKPDGRADFAEPAAAHDEQVLKVSARSFDRLLSLASEIRVAANALHPLLQSMLHLKKKQHEMFAALNQLVQELTFASTDDPLKEKIRSVQQKSDPLKQTLVEQLADIEAYERRLLTGSQAILDEVLALRIRPFRDGLQAFPRMVRDLARNLGKNVRLDILGEDTLVDRNILSHMESPLNHILRNAVDHGMEPPTERTAIGKPAEGTIRLEARHNRGMLSIQVSDDGRGVDPERIRKRIVDRKMATPQMAAAMSIDELLDFLFLPAFSLKETTTEVSGRGIGLDVVHATVRKLFGTVRLETVPGKGFRTHITLPLSQSVVRAVIVEIAGEAYAAPIAKIGHIMNVAPSEVHVLEDRQFFTLDNEHIGLVSAAQLLELADTAAATEVLPVMVIGSGQRRYALAVDRVVGEQNLAVQPIDNMFGKVRDISAAALLDDGSPVLILDVADLLVSIEKRLSEGGLHRLHTPSGTGDGSRRKRILVVDDSLTVREIERKLLLARGFEVSVAVDGMDGWNAVRSGEFDLVITDVDMPRMDGIELVTLIKKNNRLHNLPVMIVSYKDRPEDRARGVTAGADYYLTKGSFHDETLLEAVFDLIGEPGA